MASAFVLPGKIVIFQLGIIYELVKNLLWIGWFCKHTYCLSWYVLSCPKIPLYFVRIFELWSVIFCTLFLVYQWGEKFVWNPHFVDLMGVIFYNLHNSSRYICSGSNCRCVADDDDAAVFQELKKIPLVFQQNWTITIDWLNHAVKSQNITLCICFICIMINHFIVD